MEIPMRLFRAEPMPPAFMHIQIVDGGHDDPMAHGLADIEQTRAGPSWPSVATHHLPLVGAIHRLISSLRLIRPPDPAAR